jgi:hypothetical protein
VLDPRHCASRRHTRCWRSAQCQPLPPAMAPEPTPDAVRSGMLAHRPAPSLTLASCSALARLSPKSGEARGPPTVAHHDVKPLSGRRCGWISPPSAVPSHARRSSPLGTERARSWRSHAEPRVAPRSAGPGEHPGVGGVSEDLRAVVATRAATGAGYAAARRRPDLSASASRAPLRAGVLTMVGPIRSWGGECVSDEPLRFCPRCDRTNLVAVKAQRLRAADYPPEQAEGPLVFQTCLDCEWNNFSEKFREHGSRTPGS